MEKVIEKAMWNKSGNIKIGRMWNFGKLAGDGEICGCKGTCGHHCEGCYDPKNPKKSNCYVFKSYYFYGWDKITNNVISAHIRNTNAIRQNLSQAITDLSNQLKRSTKKPVACRLMTSGEIETTEELFGWIRLARENPGTPFYIYTKNFEAVDEALTKLQRHKKKMLPDNFWLNISIWHTSGIDCYQKWAKCKNVRAFVYVDGFNYKDYGLEIDCMCPAYDSKGKMDHRFTCDQCKICYSGKNKVCGCFDH